MYYPIRMMRTRTHKYLLNLAHPLEYPSASDLFNSPTWQGIRKRGDTMMGQRSVAQYLRRRVREVAQGKGGKGGKGKGGHWLRHGWCAFAADV